MTRTRIITLIFLLTIVIFSTISNRREIEETVESAAPSSNLVENEKTMTMEKANVPQVFKKVSLIKKAILDNHKVLVENKKLRKKALLSKEENLKLDTYFSNPRNIRMAYLTLLNKDFGSNFYESTSNRIDATNFLSDGLERKNANREGILKAIQMFLLSDIENDLPKNEKRAIVGDKIDLYFAMLTHAPIISQKFKENYMSERLTKVIKYVEHHTNKRKKRRLL